MAKRGHSFQITVIPLYETQAGICPNAPLTFVHANHDDILLLVDQVRKIGVLDADAAAATILGLKLLGEVMLERKADPLFDPLRGAIGEFIRNLKSLTRTTRPDAELRND